MTIFLQIRAAFDEQDVFINLASVVRLAVGNAVAVLYLQDGAILTLQGKAAAALVAFFSGLLPCPKGDVVVLDIVTLLNERVEARNWKP